MRFDIDILGDEDLREELDDLGERAKDMKPAMRAVMRFVIVPRYKKRFSGSGWKALSPDYREQKSKQGLDPRIGRATGRLEDALTAIGKTPGRTQSIAKTGVRVGVGKKLFYARFFNAERELFGWEPEDEAHALRLLDRYLFGGKTLNV